MKARTRIKIILLISLFIVAVESSIVYRGLSSGHTIKQVNNAASSAGYFSAFTIDCECFMAMVSLLGIALCIKALLKREDELPAWFDVLYLIGTASLTLVFLVVACYLAPIKVVHGQSYFLLFSKGNFYNHFLNPWLSILCLDLVNNTRRLSRKSALFAPIPMLIYAVAYFINVAVLKTWPDLYNFVPGGRYWLFPIELVVIFAITYGLGRLHVGLHNRNYSLGHISSIK